MSYFLSGAHGRAYLTDTIITSERSEILTIPEKKWLDIETGQRKLFINRNNFAIDQVHACNGWIALRIRYERTARYIINKPRDQHAYIMTTMGKNNTKILFGPFVIEVTEDNNTIFYDFRSHLLNFHITTDIEIDECSYILDKNEIKLIQDGETKQLELCNFNEIPAKTQDIITDSLSQRNIEIIYFKATDDDSEQEQAYKYYYLVVYDFENYLFENLQNVLQYSTYNNEMKTITHEHFNNLFIIKGQLKLLLCQIQSNYWESTFIKLTISIAYMNPISSIDISEPVKKHNYMPDLYLFQIEELHYLYYKKDYRLYLLFNQYINVYDISTTLEINKFMIYIDTPNDILSISSDGNDFKITQKQQYYPISSTTYINLCKSIIYIREPNINKIYSFHVLNPLNDLNIVDIYDTNIIYLIDNDSQNHYVMQMIFGANNEWLLQISKTDHIIQYWQHLPLTTRDQVISLKEQHAKEFSIINRLLINLRNVIANS